MEWIYVSNIAAIVGGVIGSLVIFTAGTLGVKYLISTKGKNSDNSFVQEGNKNTNIPKDRVDLGTDLKQVFARTQELCKYTPEIRDDQIKIYALPNCKCKGKDDVILGSSSVRSYKKGNIFVNDGDSLGGIYDFLSKNKLSGGKVAVVNFANYFQYGGGVKNGRPPQEETLFRRTNAIKGEKNRKIENFYSENNKNSSRIGKFGDHRALFVENLTYFISGGYKQYYELPKEEWKTIDMITAAALDLRESEKSGHKSKGKRYKKPDLSNKDELMKDRIRLIFEVARENGVDTLGFGAFGCGVFEWKPKDVARMCKELLIDEEYNKYFNNVIFNIPNENSKTFKEFNKVFADVYS